MLPRFNYVRARSVADAVRQLAVPGSRLHAGGTDLLGCLRDQVFTAERLVSLSDVKEMKGIVASATGGLRIGALVSNAEVAKDARVKEHYAVLAQAAASVASPQLRHQGTIGGNLCQRPRCWYYRGEFHCLRKGGDKCFAINGENQNHCIMGGEGCYIVHPSDTAPALLALGARVRIASPAGSRLVPIASFFVGPEKLLTAENILQKNEVLTEILLPPAVPGLKSAYRKVRSRGAWDFALAGVALALKMNGQTVEQARIAFSGVAPVPWRSEPAEKAIVGKALTPDTVAAAADAAVQGAEPLEQNAYKIPLLKGALTESLLALA